MQNKVMGPAIGLIVLGILGALMSLYGLLAGGLDPEALDQFEIPEEQKELILKYAQGGGSIMSLIGLAVDAFIVWAGFQMMKLKSWGAAVAANILIMVPCFTSCCCIVGVPLGIWGLIALFNADVKKAFEGQASA